MGTELVQCCTQTLSYDDCNNDSDDPNTKLNSAAKQIYHETKSNKADPDASKSNSEYLEVPSTKKKIKRIECHKRKRSQSLLIPNNKKKTRRKNKRRTKLKHKKLKRERAFSVEDSTFNASINESNDYKLINKTINDVPISPLSPLSILTHKHTNIILSYSDNSFPNIFANTFPNKSKIRSHSVPINNIEFKCQCITNCMAIKRIIEALKLYSKYDKDVLNDKIMCCYNQNHSYLVNDYQHILNYHLSQQYKRNINIEYQYQFIQNEIYKQIEPCDIQKCNGYKRYKSSSNKSNENTPFLLHIMDLVHCFLMHSEQ